MAFKTLHSPKRYVFLEFYRENKAFHFSKKVLRADTARNKWLKKLCHCWVWTSKCRLGKGYAANVFQEIFWNFQINYFSEHLRMGASAQSCYLCYCAKLKPDANYMVKVNYRNTRIRCEICSKLTIKTPKRHHWRRSGVFIINFEHISHLALVLLLVTLSRKGKGIVLQFAKSLNSHD